MAKMKELAGIRLNISLLNKYTDPSSNMLDLDKALVTSEELLDQLRYLTGNTQVRPPTGFNDSFEN